MLKSAGQTLMDACKRWSADGGPLLSAGVAYYVAISFFPVLIILLAGLGFFFDLTETGQQAEAQLIHAVDVQLSPALGQQVQKVIEEVRVQASFSGPVGLITLLIASLAMFSQFEHAFDRIWKVDSKTNRGLWRSVVLSLKTRLKAFTMLLALGVVVVVTFAAGVVLSTIEETSAELLPWDDRVGWLLDVGLTVVLNVVAFTLIYRLIPKVEVSWKHALAGGIFAAIAWDIGRQVLARFVIGQHYESAYGIVGSFLAIMLWAYYAVSVLFLGAELIQAIRAREASVEG